MKMRDLFEKDPTRRIPGVVMIDQHADQVVGVELEEYVVTPQIGKLLQGFLDGFLETRMGRTSDVCVWVSGFFGSGKSHFAKILGYMVSNREVVLPDGTKVQAGEYLSKKFGLKGMNILTKELKTTSFFYNMLKWDTAKDDNLSRYIYRQILATLGYSEIPWVAEIEDSIRKDGLWDEFVGAVKEATGEDWAEVRETTIKVRPVLVKALVRTRPGLYANEEATEKAIALQQEEHRVNPPRLVKRLLLEAERIHPENGRIVLILDEVGLYLKGNVDRLVELNSLAEEIEKAGKGKIWLVATAQESLDSIDAGGAIGQEQIGWLRDRFTQKYQLDPRNIPQVVEVRLLKKREESPALAILKGLFQKHEGELATACLIDGASRDTSVFASFDWDSFEKSYPLLPYHIPVMMSTFAALRTKGRRIGQETQLAGRERAILSVVRSVVGKTVSSDSSIGLLVTFDLLYDAIESALQIVSSEQHHLITGRISEIGQIEGMDTASVAKALFLLQQIQEWIPPTPKNIAAVLYPGLGASSAEHLSRVEQCLNELKTRKWVREEEGVFRFLSEMERNFEDEVNQQSKSLMTHELTEKSIDVTRTLFRNMRKYNHRNVKVFEVGIQVDGEDVYKGGLHTLRIFTPLLFGGDNKTEDSVYRSMGDDRSVYWLSGEDDAFASRIRRTLALKKTLDEWGVKTHQDLRELETYRQELTRLEDDLPHALDLALRNGKVLFRGAKYEVNPKDGLDATFYKWMAELTEIHYTRFDEAGVRVKDKDIELVLDWRGGKLPTVCKELKLVDSQGNPVMTGPVAHAILQEISRSAAAIEGGALVSRFEEPPFGWDESVIRLVLAFLYKQSTVQAEPSQHSVFTRSSEFRKGKFAAGTVLSSEEIAMAKETVSKIFGCAAGITPDEISENLLNETKKLQDAIQTTKTLDGFYLLPYADAVDSIVLTIDKVQSQQSSSSRIRILLEKDTSKKLKEGVKFLAELQRFIDQGHLHEFTKAKAICSKLKRELGNRYYDLSSSVDSLEEKLSGNVIQEWSSLYETYVKASGEYRRQYLEQHARTQTSAQSVLKQVEEWTKQHKVDKQTKAEVEKAISSVVCTTGVKGSYDDEQLLCKSCGRDLPTLALHEERAKQLGEKAITHLVETSARKGKKLFDDNMQKTLTVKNESELQESLRRISEFARFWIAQGKRVRLVVEGQAEHEE